METDSVIKKRLETVLPSLNERQRRVYLAAEAQSIGWVDLMGRGYLTALSLMNNTKDDASQIGVSFLRCTKTDVDTGHRLLFLK